MFGFFKKKRPPKGPALSKPSASEPEVPKPEFLPREEFLDLLTKTSGWEAFAAWGSMFGYEQYESLPPIWRSLGLHDYCYADTLNGGFYQLFYNGSGDHYEDFVRIYDLIGATEAASLVREAGAIFPEGPPEDRDARNDLMTQLGMTEGTFDDIDTRFFKWSFQPPEQLRALYESYLVAHVDDGWPPDFQIRTPALWPPPV